MHRREQNSRSAAPLVFTVKTVSHCRQVTSVRPLASRQASEQYFWFGREAVARNGVPQVAQGASGARRTRPWQVREQNLAVSARCAATSKLVPHWAQHTVTGGRLGRRVAVLTERTVRP